MYIAAKAGKNFSPAKINRSAEHLSKPRVLISRCLLGHKCRYDGKIFTFCEIKQLKQHFQLIPICPEARLGLNSPRPPIKLIKTRSNWLLHQPASNNYFQEKITGVLLKYIKNFNLEAMILKEKSPTCGPQNCKYYFLKRSSVQGRASGFLPGLTAKFYPHLPIISETKLQDSRQLFYFLQKLYAHFNWRKLLANYSIARLQKFHADYKLYLLGFSRELVDSLGRMVAEQQQYNRTELQKQYYDKFMECLSLDLNRASWKNVILHGFGHISEEVSPGEKRKFLNMVEKFSQEEINNYLQLNQWLKQKADKYKKDYLRRQKFLNPYPEEINKSLHNCGLTPEPF